MTDFRLLVDHRVWLPQKLAKEDQIHSFFPSDLKKIKGGFTDWILWDRDLKKNLCFLKSQFLKKTFREVFLIFSHTEGLVFPIEKALSGFFIAYQADLIRVCFREFEPVEFWGKGSKILDNQGQWGFIYTWTPGDWQSRLESHSKDLSYLRSRSSLMDSGVS
jgi:hypothetical protein